MPSISKIRFTNVIYENGGKRYNDDIFEFDGQNSAILLENGGGKTVFVQTAIQAILPNYNLKERKIRETLSLEGGPCHIAIEWILNEKPRRYLLTAVTLFIKNNKLESYKYIYEYESKDKDSIVEMPFVINDYEGSKRPADRGEIVDYYQNMQSKHMAAKMFDTSKLYHKYIEENYKIIPSEWRSIGRINGAEGGVENYFDSCKSTSQLVNNLLIPVVQEAIDDGGTKDFVEIFENQRERFKKHKQLRERIAESEKIEAKISDYVDVFKNYDIIRKENLNKKGYVKSVLEYVKNEKINIDEDLNNNEIERLKIENDLQYLNQKKSSYELELEKLISENCKREKENAEGIYLECKSLMDEKKRLCQNLEIAKLKNKIKITQEKLIIANDKLKNLENELDLEAIKEQIEENRAMLRGYYLNREEGYKKEIEKTEIDKDRFETELQEEIDDLEQIIIVKENLSTDLNLNQGQVLEIQNNLKSIKNDITALNPNDDIKNQQKKWMSRIGILEQIVAESITNISHIEHEEMIEKENLDEIVRLARELDRESTILKEQIKVNYNEETQILTKIKNLNESWYHYDSIYKREISIRSYLENKIDLLKKEKEHLLENERRSGRYLDDYGNQMIFTVEPLIQEWILKWRSKFKMIESGTKYIQRILNELGDKYSSSEIDPLWASAVVVKEAEVDKIKELLQNVSEKMIYPVCIISEEESLNYLNKSVSISEKIISPKHWKDNIKPEFFENWKIEIENDMKMSIEMRNQKEREIDFCSQCFNEVLNFLKKYPYDELRIIEKSLEEHEDNIKSKILEQKNIEKHLIEISQTKKYYLEEKEQAKEEKNQLNIWVQNLQKYIEKENEVNRIISTINEIKDDIEKHNSKINIKKRTCDIIKNKRDTVLENFRDFSNQLNILRLESYYIEVKNLDPIYSDWTKEGIINKYKTLNEIYNQNQGDLNRIKDDINLAKLDKEELTKELDLVRKTMEYPIDEYIEFNLYGDEIFHKIKSEIFELKSILELKEKIYDDMQKKLSNQESRVAVIEESFLKKFDKIVKFEESLQTVNLKLSDEKKSIAFRNKEAYRVYENILKDEEEIKSVINKFEILNGKYEFMGEDIKAICLNSDFSVEFSYNRMKFTDNIAIILKELREKTDLVFDKLENYKKWFIKYSEETIKNTQLKERTVLGIKKKRKYEDVLQWQNLMTKSIQQIIKYSEEDMRDHDKDLEQFVNYLQIYLKAISDELCMIPKKTRIKVEDNWKEIFAFQIPSWEEEEGKSEIRKYIDWILESLDGNVFKNVDGTENSASIHTQIEKLLDVKQLLPVIMKNNIIKVRCRKVRNDNKISSEIFSWESSNKWSGGEKWSKNMTLFLGILNYVAEKRQGITSEHNNRTVIVDNPFGQASSGHVLAPVFYIAEKLGFQMIALTAHSEGNFIRRYFPVVYSCRLRPSTNNKSMIMHKEKEIKYVFFKDNQPETWGKNSL